MNLTLPHVVHLKVSICVASDQQKVRHMRESFFRVTAVTRKKDLECFIVPENIANILQREKKTQNEMKPLTLGNPQKVYLVIFLWHGVIRKHQKVQMEKQSGNQKKFDATNHG